MRGSERSFVALRPSGALPFGGGWVGRAHIQTHTHTHSLRIKLCACRYTEAVRHGRKHKNAKS